MCLPIRGMRQCDYHCKLHWPATIKAILNFAGLRQASSLFKDVVTIQRALSHSRRQGYLKHFFDTGQRSDKNCAGTVS